MAWPAPCSPSRSIAPRPSSPAVPITVAEPRAPRPARAAAGRGNGALLVFRSALTLAFAAALAGAAPGAPPANDDEAERAELQQALGALEVLAAAPVGAPGGLNDPRA